MKLKNISGRTLTVKAGRCALQLTNNQIGTFPDDAQAQTDAKRWVDLEYCQLISDPNEAISGDLDTPASVLLAATAQPNVLTAATDTLTSNNTNVSNNDTVTVNGKVYTFKTTLTPAEGEVLISVTNADGSLTNLANAINHAGTPGTDYSCAAAHPQVSSSAVASHILTFSARTKGTAGNSLTLAKSAVTLTVGGANFSGGLDNGTVTVNGKIFEFNSDATTVDPTHTGVTVGANTGATMTALQTAINADPTLQSLAILATDIAAINTSSDVRLMVRGLSSTAVAVSESTNNLTATSVAAVDRNAGELQMTTYVATGTTALLDTGLKSVDTYLLQVMSSTGVRKAWDGTVTAYGGLLYMADTGSVHLANTDVVTLVARG